MRVSFRQVHDRARTAHEAGSNERKEGDMADNRAIAYMGPGKVEVKSIDFPKLETPRGKKAEHGVILKIVTTNICGSDLHMVHGRTPSPPGTVLGHEITGEVIECGRDVEFIRRGDLVSVPFNIACGRCRNCRERNTQICLNVNPEQPGGAYGYAGMGGWIGGQAEFVMAPYADFNLLKFPDKDQAMEKVRDLTLLSDILPTGFDGAVNAGVKPGVSVYISGAGPVGLACAVSCQLLGAAVIIVGDRNRERLKLASDMGCETVDIASGTPLPDWIESILGMPEVDCAVDCVGFEAHGMGPDVDREDAAGMLNALFEIVRAGGSIGLTGVYLPESPNSPDAKTGKGIFDLNLGSVWGKSLRFGMGQAPVMKYHRELMWAILEERIRPAKAVNVTVISLDDAPKGYAEFNHGAAHKFVIDPHGGLESAAQMSAKS
jgi:glutathione-independent formaldehyde dehydrogenase